MGSSAGIPKKAERSLNTTKPRKDGTNCSKKSPGSEPIVVPAVPAVQTSNANWEFVGAGSNPPRSLISAPHSVREYSGLMTPANYVENSLTFFLTDDFKSALQRRQKLLGIVYQLAVATMRGNDHFIARSRRQITQRKVVRAYRPTVRHDLLRRGLGGVPDSVVANDCEHRKVVGLRDEMATSRVAKHVRSVADAGNHG